MSQNSSSNISPLVQSQGQSRVPGWFASTPSQPYLPNPVDVLIVKAMLARGLSLPPEILDIIIDHAEYWSCTETAVEFAGSNGIRITGGGANENQLIIRSPPIGFTSAEVGEEEVWRQSPPANSPPEAEVPSAHFKTLLKTIPTLEHPVRKIVFKLRARDQGWGGNREHHNTFQGSWTWFEAGLERFETPTDGDQTGITRPFDASVLRTVHPSGELVTRPNGRQQFEYPLHHDDRLTIQRNRTATRQAADYEVTWRWTDNVRPNTPEADRLDEMGRGPGSGDGEFVRNLRLGDVVSIWGKARFGGWANNVEKASVQVYWAM